MEPTETVLAKITSVKARETLRRWVDLMSVRLIPADWHGDGFTDAQLLGVYVEGDKDFTGAMILKIKDEGDGDKEFKAHRRAYRDAPQQFADEHLAQPVGYPLQLEQGGSITFQRVAGGDFEGMMEIDKALPHYVRATTACRSITMSLLTEWTSKPSHADETVGAVLGELLGDRCTGGGPIAAWAADHPGLLRNPRRWLSHGGALINPFALIEEASSMLVTRGKVHGDLHPGNLLISRNEHDAAYCLVDLSRYTDSGLLCWDPTYLALTTVAKHLPAVSLGTRERLQQHVLNPGTDPHYSWPLALKATVSEVHSAGLEWAQQAIDKSAWRRQRLLCLIAISLILTGRSLLSPDTRTWFFWLAAKAATQLLVERTMPAPSSADLLTPPGQLFGADVIEMADRRAPEAPSITEEVESWNGLVAELQVVDLAAPDRAFLVARTEKLRNLLDRTRTLWQDRDDTTGRYLGDLDDALKTAFRPGTRAHEVQAAIETAELRRTWLLPLLS